MLEFNISKVKDQYPQSYVKLQEWWDPNDMEFRDLYDFFDSFGMYVTIHPEYDYERCEMVNCFDTKTDPEEESGFEMEQCRNLVGFTYEIWAASNSFIRSNKMYDIEDRRLCEEEAFMKAFELLNII